MDAQDKVAILVDGGFYLKRAKYLWGKKTPSERAKELHSYCTQHLSVWDRGEKCYRRDLLYRIFYYDCPPSIRKVYHPMQDRTVDLGKSDSHKFMTEFLNELRNKRKTALRLGALLESDLQYTLPPMTVRKLVKGTMQISNLKPEDFILTITQKGVDMRIGLDIASMAYKKQVSKIILISGDSDFVPAAKLARREGIDFVLDSMNASILPSLNEHIDGRKSFPQPFPQAIKNTKKSYRVQHPADALSPAENTINPMPVDASERPNESLS